MVGALCLAAYCVFVRSCCGGNAVLEGPPKPMVLGAMRKGKLGGGQLAGRGTAAVEQFDTANPMRGAPAGMRVLPGLPQSNEIRVGGVRLPLPRTASGRAVIGRSSSAARAAALNAGTAVVGRGQRRESRNSYEATAMS